MLSQEQGPFKFPAEIGSPREEFISQQTYYKHYQQELGNVRAPELLQQQRRMKQPNMELWERVCSHKDFLALIEADGPADLMADLTNGFPNRPKYLHDLNELLDRIVEQKQAKQNLSEEDEQTLLMVYEIIRSWMNNEGTWFYVVWDEGTEFDLDKAIVMILRATTDGPQLRILDLSSMHKQIKFRPVSTRLFLIMLLSFWAARVPGFRKIRTYLCNKALTLLDNFTVQAGENFDNAVALTEHCSRICGADYVALVFADRSYKLYPAELFHDQKIVLFDHYLYRGKTEFGPGDRPNLEAIITKAKKVVSGRDDMKSWKLTGKTTLDAQAFLTFRRRRPCFGPATDHKVRIFVSPASQCSGPVPADELALT